MRKKPYIVCWQCSSIHLCYGISKKWLFIRLKQKCKMVKKSYFTRRKARTFANGKRANLKKGVSRKESMPNFPKNEHFSPPDSQTYVCVSEGKKCLFLENLACFVFLKHAFWDSSFCLNTDELIVKIGYSYKPYITLLIEGVAC